MAANGGGPLLAVMVGLLAVEGYSEKKMRLIGTVQGRMRIGKLRSFDVDGKPMMAGDRDAHAFHGGGEGKGAGGHRTNKSSCMLDGASRGRLKSEMLSTRLQSLRQLIKDNDLDAYIVQTADEHQSEEIRECDRRREFLTGFDGTAGTCLVTKDRAILFTDGRYWLQAEKQVTDAWQIERCDLASYLGSLQNDKRESSNTSQARPHYSKHRTNSHKGMLKFGFDPMTTTPRDIIQWQDQLEGIGVLRASGGLSHHRERYMEEEGDICSSNLLDQVWEAEGSRPPCAEYLIGAHDLCFAGASIEDKISKIKKILEEKKAGALIVSKLDEIAWLFNLRGGDVPYSPTFWGYAEVLAQPGREGRSSMANQTGDSYTKVVSTRLNGGNPSEHLSILDDQNLNKNRVKVQGEDQLSTGNSVSGGVLYVRERQLTDDALQMLTRAGVQVVDSASIPSERLAYLQKNHGPVWLDSRTTNMNIWGPLQGIGSVIDLPSPIMDFQEVKNDAEIEGSRVAQLSDGIAMVKFFANLEHLLQSGETISEYQAAQLLDKQRASQEHFYELAFPTISAADANGAMIHYSPKKNQSGEIGLNSMYLVDSGGQYRCGGTTDTTRTINFGTPSKEHKGNFTNVLKAHIAVATAIIEPGATAMTLDRVARTLLKEKGMNFEHSSSHGVGAFLDVHEGNQTSPLRAGMMLSNEPGYYVEGEFGIRIENTVLIANYDDACPGCMKVETITLVPIDRNLVEKEMLTKPELNWLNSYHEMVRSKLTSNLREDQVANLWLERATAKL
ncbi:hypothetical protein AAMO2058_001293800 [Amorphochlora amoebiformis]